MINAALDGGTVTLTFDNPRKPGDIEVIKLDATDRSTLAGAVFQLWADNDKTAGTPTATRRSVFPRPPVTTARSA